MSEKTRPYIPAAGNDWLLPFYDPLNWLIGAEKLHRILIEQADLRAGQRVLEIGCGTGNVTILAKRLHPDAEIAGLDPDPRALARARRKAQRAGVDIRWIEGFADKLPHEDRSIDRVLSSLMLHHLTTDAKCAALREIARVLRPGGSLHVLDFGGSRAGSDGLLARLLHDRGHLEDNLQGRIPTLMRKAGLAEPAELASRPTLFGHVGYWRAAAVTSD
jgi:ubiquinone/menaquinone biosynthesis C-methylase UbiE